MPPQEVREFVRNHVVEHLHQDVDEILRTLRLHRPVIEGNERAVERLFPRFARIPQGVRARKHVRMMGCGRKEPPKFSQQAEAYDDCTAIARLARGRVRSIAG